MRSERVETNLRCNQNCTYCTARRSEDDVRWIQKAAVLSRIDRALEAGRGVAAGLELILTGGEPTLRRDLSELVAHGKRGGARQVTLETNATRVDRELARSLVASGLDHAVVNLAGVDETLDAMTRDPGGFAQTLLGIDALLDAGVTVTLRAVVVRSTKDALPRLPAFVRQRFGSAIRALELAVADRAPDPTELLSPEAAAEVVARVEASARKATLPLKLAPGSGPPPCTFLALDRVTHLFALSPGATARSDHRPIAACAECVVRDRCSGFPTATLERFGTPTVKPLTTDRARRRLAVLTTVEEQVDREFVTPNRFRDSSGGQVDEDLIRVVFACNQSCRFCFVSTHLPGVDDARIEAAIRAATDGDRKVTLSGGEPTLHPRLSDFIRLAKSRSRHGVLLQTNAIRMGERPGYAAALREAGLDEVFVSLHGASAAISDAVTETPGTFDETVRGLDALRDAGLNLQINFVICRKNAHELPAWVELVAQRWPSAFANVSFVAPSTDVVPRDHELVPRYADVLPFLFEAMRIAEARGVTIGGFDSMCGVPLCLVPSELEHFFALAAVPPGFDGGEFVKPEPCTRCALASKCWGVRRGYLELHGESELAPIP